MTATEGLSTRYAYIDGLVDALSQQGWTTGVQILPYNPGDTIESTAVWCDETDGTVQIPTMRAGRKARDDEFTTVWKVQVILQSDYLTTRDRLAEIIAGFETQMATDPTLDDIASFPLSAAVIDSQVTAERSHVAATRAGFVGFGEVTISTHLRLA